MRQSFQPTLASLETRKVGNFVLAESCRQSVGTRIRSAWAALVAARAAFEVSASVGDSVRNLSCRFTLEISSLGLSYLSIRSPLVVDGLIPVVALPPIISLCWVRHPIRGLRGRKRVWLSKNQ